MGNAYILVMNFYIKGKGSRLFEKWSVHMGAGRLFVCVCVGGGSSQLTFVEVVPDDDDIGPKENFEKCAF